MLEQVQELGPDSWILATGIYLHELSGEGAEGSRWVKNALHDVVSAGDLVEASLVCRVGCILRQGAGLLKTHLPQSLTAGCAAGRVQEQFCREGAA